MSSPPASREVEFPAFPSLFLAKTPSIMHNSHGLNAAGAIITYEYILTNTGNVTLSSFHVADSKVPSSDISCRDDTLSPGASTTCVVTQADVNRGRVINTATASATHAGQQVMSNRARARVALDQVRSLSLAKDGHVTGTGPGGLVLGDTIAYTYRVENTGTVTV